MGDSHVRETWAGRPPRPALPPTAACVVRTLCSGNAPRKGDRCHMATPMLHPLLFRGHRWPQRPVLSEFTAMGDHAPSRGSLQGTRKPNPPQKPLPADPLSKGTRLSHASTRTPRQPESGLHLAPLRSVRHRHPSSFSPEPLGPLHEARLSDDGRAGG